MFIDLRGRWRGTKREGGGREGERERDRQTDRDINWLPPLCFFTGNRTHNLGVRLDQESNLQPLGIKDDAPTN